MDQRLKRRRQYEFLFHTARELRGLDWSGHYDEGYFLTAEVELSLGRVLCIFSQGMCAMTGKDAAQALLRMYWDLALPINPVKMATSLGLRVFYSQELNDLGGYYDQRERAIYVNENDPITRQRFSIAHELGHAVLGHGSSPRRNDVVYNKGNYLQNESAANRFAATLLMPEVAVRTLVEQKNMLLNDLCTEFDVSQAAMTIRLEELGYI